MARHHRCKAAALLAGTCILTSLFGMNVLAAENDAVGSADPGYQIAIASEITIDAETNTATIPITGTVAPYHELTIHVTSARTGHLVNEEDTSEDLAYAISEETMVLSNRDGDEALQVDRSVTVRVCETATVGGAYTDTLTFTMESVDHTPEMTEAGEATEETTTPTEDPSPAVAESEESKTPETTSAQTSEAGAELRDPADDTTTASNKITSPEDTAETTETSAPDENTDIKTASEVDVETPSDADAETPAAADAPEQTDNTSAETEPADPTTYDAAATTGQDSTPLPEVA